MEIQDSQDSFTNEDSNVNVTVPTPTVEETPLIDVPLLEAHEIGDEPEKIEVSVQDCEMLYGAALETAHAILTKGSHRGIPEQRRKAQGAMLATICERYNIEIPTELSIVIFGGALFADWQYMGAGESEDEPESTPKPKKEQETDKEAEK